MVYIISSTIISQSETVYFNVNDPKDERGLTVNHKIQIICQLVVSFIYLQMLELNKSWWNGHRKWIVI